MDGFSNRKKAFETKFSHDEELQFRITARRNRMLGLWAAELMGMNPDDAANYAQEVIMSSFENPLDGHLAQKVYEDLIDAQIEMSERRVLKELENLHQKAHTQVYKDTKE